MITRLDDLQEQLDEDRELLAAIMMENGFATGHGDTIRSLLVELRWQLQKHYRAALPAGQLMSDTTVSCTGMTITIECGTHDTKDAMMDFLVDAAFGTAKREG